MKYFAWFRTTLLIFAFFDTLISCSSAQLVTFSQPLPQLFGLSFDQTLSALVISIQSEPGIPLSSTYSIEWGLSLLPESDYAIKSVDSSELLRGVLIRDLDIGAEYIFNVRDSNGVIQPTLNGNNVQLRASVPQPVDMFLGEYRDDSLNTTMHLYFQLEDSEGDGFLDGVELRKHAELPRNAALTRDEMRCIGSAATPGQVGTCCNRDNECQTGVCDKGRRTCTTVCTSNRECLASQPNFDTPGHVWTVSACVPEATSVRDASRLVCDTSRLVAQNIDESFCVNTCAVDIRQRVNSTSTCPFDPAHPASPCSRSPESTCSRMAALQNQGTSGPKRLLADPQKDWTASGSQLNRLYSSPSKASLTSQLLGYTTGASKRSLAEASSLCPVRQDIPQCGTNATLFDAQECARSLLQFCEGSAVQECHDSVISSLQHLDQSLVVAIQDWLPSTNISAAFHISATSGRNCRIDQSSSEFWTHSEDCADDLLHFCQSDAVYSNDPRCIAFIAWHETECISLAQEYCLSGNPLDPYCVNGVELNFVHAQATVQSSLRSQWNLVINEKPFHHGFGVYSVPVSYVMQSNPGSLYSIRLRSGEHQSLPLTSFTGTEPLGFLATQRHIIEHSHLRVSPLGEKQDGASVSLTVPETAFQASENPTYTQPDKFRLEWDSVDHKDTLSHVSTSGWIEVNTSATMEPAGDGFVHFGLEIKEISPPNSVFEFRVLLHSGLGGYWEPLASDPPLTRLPRQTTVRPPSIHVTGFPSSTSVLFQSAKHPLSVPGDVFVLFEWGASPDLVLASTTSGVPLLGTISESPAQKEVSRTSSQDLFFARSSIVDDFGVQSRPSTVIGVAPQAVPPPPGKVRLDLLRSSAGSLLASIRVTEPELNSTTGLAGAPLYYLVEWGFLEPAQLDAEDPVAWTAHHVARGSSSPTSGSRALEDQHRVVGSVAGVLDDFSTLCAGTSGGVFGDCCEGDGDCGSGVCDAGTRSCTLRCAQDHDCPAEPLSGRARCLRPRTSQMGTCAARKSMSLYGTPYCETCAPAETALDCIFDRSHPLSPCATGSACVTAPGELACEVHIVQYCVGVNPHDLACHTPASRALVAALETTYCPFDALAQDSPCGPNGGCTKSGLFHPSEACEWAVLSYCQFDSSGAPANMQDPACRSALLHELADQVDRCPFADAHPWSPCAGNSPCNVPYVDANATLHHRFVQYSGLHETLLQGRVWNASFTGPAVETGCRRRIESYCALVNVTDPGCHLAALRAWVGDFNSSVHDHEQGQCGKVPPVTATALSRDLGAEVGDGFPFEFEIQTELQDGGNDPRFRLRVSACNSAGCGTSTEARSSRFDPPHLASRNVVYLSADEVCATEPGADLEATSYMVSISPDASALPVTVEVITDGAILRAEPAIVELTANATSQRIAVFVENKVFDTAGAGYYTSLLQHQVVSGDGAMIDGSGELAVKIFQSGWTGVAAYPMDIQVSEAGVSPTVDVVLLSQPSGSGGVEVLLTTDDLQIILEPSYLVFDKATWDTPQTVEVRAVDDKYAEPVSQFQEIMVQVLSSDSPELSGKYTVINVQNLDNDVPYLVQVITSEVDGTTTLQRFCEGVAEANLVGESLQRTIFFRLNTKPRDTVTVEFGGVPGVLEVITPVVTIEPESWNEPFPVTVLAVNNYVDTGDILLNAPMSCLVSSTDKDYNIVGNENFAIQNDDSSNVFVSKKILNVAEANNLGEGSLQDTFFIRLGTEPAAPVTYTFLDAGSQVWINPPSIQFNSETWNSTQMVTVSAIPDGDEGEELVHKTSIVISVASTDTFYSSIVVPDIDVSITDASAIADLTPAPELLSAKLEDTAHNLTVVFDRESNMAGHEMGVLGSCESIPEQVPIFSPETEARLGEGILCYFESPNVLKVVLGPGYSVSGGDTVTIQGGTIRVNDKSVLYTVGEVAVQGRVPPPSLQDAIFSDNGASISVTFSGPTSQQVSGADLVPCELAVLEAYLLGAGSECQFTDATTLLVTLGVGSAIEPSEFGVTSPPTNGTEPPTSSGESNGTARLLASESCEQGKSITLLPGAITAVKQGILYTTGCVNIRPPLSPPEASPVISGVTSLGLCDNLELNALQSVGGAGRKMQLEWVVHTNSSLGGNISEVVNEQQSLRSLAIPRELITAGEKLKVELRAKNYLNPLPGVALVQVTKISLPIPSIRILGPSQVRTTRSRGTTQLIAQGKSPSCGSGNSGRRIVYSWRTLEGPLNVEDPSLFSVLFGRDSRKVSIPADLMEVGQSYTFEVIGRMAQDLSISNSATVQLVVESDEVIAKINGKRIVGAADVVELDGLSSVDKDSLVDVPFAFDWSCVDLSTGFPCKALGEDTLLDLSAYYFDGGSLEYGNGAIVRVAGGTLQPKTTYLFTLQVSKPDALSGGFRSSNTTVEVEVRSGSPPGALIKPIVGKVNPSKKVVLEGEVTSKLMSSLSSWWVNVDGKLDDSDPTALYSLGPIGPQLIVKPGVLSPGSSYLFRLTAKDAWAESSTDILITANAAPTSGYLVAHRQDDVASNRGIMLNTTFTIQALDWTDDVDDMPLSYSYAFVIGDFDGEKEQQPISEFSQDATVNYFFPRGDPEQEGKITLVVYVQDRLGAEVSTSRNSTGLPTYVYVDMEKMNAAETAAFISNAADSLLSASVEDADPVTLYAALNVLSDLMEDLDDPCEEVDCGLHGVCLEGLCECTDMYTGDFCDVPPPEPINAGYSEWSDWSACSFACGGGLQSSTRTCDNPAAQFGGLSCDEQNLGPVYRERECNTDPCVTVTNGGYSAWSQWSECSSSCGQEAGFFPGEQVRSRTCDNPSPSPDGLDCSGIGPATEARACNTERCPAPVKKCPGSILVVDETSGESSLVPCSGNGECTRTRPLEECTEEDTNCIVACICDDGWKGENCDVDQAEMERRQKLRTQFIESMVSMNQQVDSSSKGLQQQASSLAKISSKPSEMGEKAQNLTFTFISSMSESASGSGDGLDATAASSMAGTVSNLVLATGLNKVQANLRANRRGSSRNRRLQSEDEIKQAAVQSANSIRESLENIGNAVISAKVPGEEQSSMETPQLKLTVRKQSPAAIGSLSLASGVSFDFPSSLSYNRDDTENGIDMQAVQWTTNPYGWSSSSDDLVSGITSMKLGGSQGEIKVEELPEPILFLVPITKTSDLETASCSYWDAENEEFTNKGMLIAGYRRVGDKLFLECETLHLTDFSAIKSTVTPDVNLVDPIGDAALLLTIDLSNALPIWVLIGLSIIFAFLFVVGYISDKRKSKVLELYRREKYLQTGKVTGNSGEVFTKRKLRMSVWARFVEGIKSEHDWGSIVSPEIPDHAVLSRTQRLAVLFSNCMCAIAVCAMFYGTQQGNVGSVLVVAAISAAMMLPSSVVFPMAFKYVNKMNSPATLESRSRRTLKHKLRAKYHQWKNRKRSGNKYKIQDDPGNPNVLPTSPAKKTSVHKITESEESEIGNAKMTKSMKKAFSRQGSAMHLLDHDSDEEAEANQQPRPNLTIDTLAPLRADAHDPASSVRSLPQPSPHTPHVQVPIRALQTPSGKSSNPNPELIKSVSMVLRKPVVKLKRLKKISDYERYAIEERRRGRRPIPQHLHNMICRVQARVRGKLARMKYEQQLLEVMRRRRYEQPHHVIPAGKCDDDLTPVRRWEPPIKGKLAWAEKARAGGKGPEHYYTYGEHKPVILLQRFVRGHLSRVRVGKLKALLARIEEVKDRAASQRALRVRCASRIQASYRGRAGRRRAERAIEYDRWKRQNKGRRLLTAVVYFVVTITILFTFYINLIYGVKFDNDQAYGWIIASLTSIALDAFLQKPLKLLFKAFAGPYFALALQSMVPF